MSCTPFSSAAYLQTTSTRAWAPWQLHALQPDPRLRRKRLAKQAAGGHQTPSTWYLPPQPTPRPTQRATRLCETRPTDQVDGVYVVLGGKPGQLHALCRLPTHACAGAGHLTGAEDYVDAVYMVLAAAAHALANAACDALV